jgi:hypothetical protein
VIRWWSSEKVIKYVQRFIQVPFYPTRKIMASSKELYISMRRIIMTRRDTSSANFTSH